MNHMDLDKVEEDKELFISPAFSDPLHCSSLDIY
jgi:hypothetical protein